MLITEHVLDVLSDQRWRETMLLEQFVRQPGFAELIVHAQPQ